MSKRTIVFLHGWSVTHTDTYGGLPEQLAKFGGLDGSTFDLHDLRLGRYVSFRDEVRMPDLVRALESAVRTELKALIDKGERFTVVTHSTGGPLAREWWWRYYAGTGAPCPMSHLIMLAPANFGSALAQLGKGKISQLKSWAEGVQPGQGVLDWLELGSPEAWQLNERWIRGQFKKHPQSPVFPVVVTGQTIDRKLYDFVNSYTGEIGSDGVVRVAAANLNATMLRLRQVPLVEGNTAATESPLRLQPKTINRAPRTAFRLLAGAAHSGTEKGIMRAVSANSKTAAEVVDVIRRAMIVSDDASYEALCNAFAQESAAVYAAERCEIEPVKLLPDRKYINDAMSMLVFRISDSDGNAVTDFELVLTGPENDPNQLPSGFFKDRQRNNRAKNTVTYYVNHELLFGTDEVKPDGASSAWREKQPGVSELGLRVTGRPDEGFAHYIPAQFVTTKNELAVAIRAHQTVLVDIVLQRIVKAGAVQLGRGDEPRKSFKDQALGMVIPERDSGEQ